MVVGDAVSEQDSFQMTDYNPRIARLCLNRYKWIEIGQLCRKYWLTDLSLKPSMTPWKGFLYSLS